ncbi:MAG: hypothetical protein AAGU17_03840 [Anaerolineaceae bacterium]|jgi:hypothetical protein
MTLIPIVIIVIIFALVIVYVTRPLFTMPDEDPTLSTGSDAERLVAEYKAILERINELDFDFNLGKLTRVDYDSQRGEFLSQASSLRRQLKTEKSTPESAGS